MCQPFSISPRTNIRLTSYYYTDFFIYLLIHRQNSSSLPLGLQLAYCARWCSTSAFLLQSPSGSRLFGCKYSGSNFPTFELQMQIHPVMWQHHFSFRFGKKKNKKIHLLLVWNAYVLKRVCHFYLERHLNYVYFYLTKINRRHYALFSYSLHLAFT